MGDSLQDQLLNLGLVTRTDVSKANKSKRKKTRQRAQQKQPDETRIRALQAQQEKIARDRDLNTKIVARQKRKAEAAELRQLIESREIKDAAGDIAFNFPHRRKVKQVQVSKTIHQQLASGKVGIVRLDERYVLVPREIADRARVQDANMFTFVVDTNEQAGDVEAEYAEYQVPDDLIW